MANNCYCQLKISGTTTKERIAIEDQIKEVGVLDALAPEPAPTKRVKLHNEELDDAWRSKHWGVDWALLEKDAVISTEDSLLCRFITPWNPPIPAVSSFAERNPNAIITLRYCEESQESAGVFVAKGAQQKHTELSPLQAFAYFSEKNLRDDAKESEEEDEELLIELYRRQFERQDRAIEVGLQNLETDLVNDINHGSLSNPEEAKTFLAEVLEQVKEAKALDAMIEVAFPELVASRAA